MTCYCSGCVTAFLSRSLILETFTIQIENPRFVLYPGLNFNGKFEQNQLCYLSVRGEWITKQPSSLQNYCIWPFLFFILSFVWTETQHFRSDFLLPAANMQTLNYIPEDCRFVFCTSQSFYSANSYIFSYEGKNREGMVLSEKQWSET